MVKLPSNQPAENDLGRYTNIGPNQDLTAYGGDFDENGGDIRTTDRVGPAGYNGGDYTNTFGGTSAAAPMVSGAAALILSINPNLSRTEVENILYTTATDLGIPGKDNTYGYGKVNLRDACLKALNTRETFSGGFNINSLSASNMSKDNDNITRIFDSPACDIAAGAYLCDVWRLEETIPSDEFVYLGDGLSGNNPNNGNFYMSTTLNGGNTDVLTFFYFIRTDMSARTINRWLPVDPFQSDKFREYITNSPADVYLTNTILPNNIIDTSASSSVNLLPGFDSQLGSSFCAQITIDLKDLPLPCLPNPSALGKKEGLFSVNSSNEVIRIAKEKQNIGDDVHVFPNPSKDQFHIDLGQNVLSADYELLSANRQILTAGELKNTTTTVYHSLKEGVYLIRIQLDKHSVIKKLIVN